MASDKDGFHIPEASHKVLSKNGGLNPHIYAVSFPSHSGSSAPAPGQSKGGMVRGDRGSSRGEDTPSLPPAVWAEACCRDLRTNEGEPVGLGGGPVHVRRSRSTTGAASLCGRGCRQGSGTNSRQNLLPERQPLQTRTRRSPKTPLPLLQAHRWGQPPPLVAYGMRRPTAFGTSEKAPPMPPLRLHWLVSSTAEPTHECTGGGRQPSNSNSAR